jgi:hypothetical protein
LLKNTSQGPILPIFPGIATTQLPHAHNYPPAVIRSPLRGGPRAGMCSMDNQQIRSGE